MSWNEREQKAWGMVFGEKSMQLLTNFKAKHGEDALKEFAIVWAESEEEWLRQNRPGHILLQLLDERRELLRENEL